MRTRTICGVSQGDLPISITWLKDGRKLESNVGVEISDIDPYSSLLNVARLDSSHSGEYTCTASNPAAEVRYTAKLQVQGKVTYKDFFCILYFFFLVINPKLLFGARKKCKIVSLFCVFESKKKVYYKIVFVIKTFPNFILFSFSYKSFIC